MDKRDCVSLKQESKCTFCDRNDELTSWFVRIFAVGERITHCGTTLCTKLASYYGFRHRFDELTFVAQARKGGIFLPQYEALGERLKESQKLYQDLGFLVGAKYNVVYGGKEYPGMELVFYKPDAIHGAPFLDDPKSVIKGNVLLCVRDGEHTVYIRVSLNDIIRLNPGAIKENACYILKSAIAEQREASNPRFNEGKCSAASCDS